jgi:hypothetical protein
MANINHFDETSKKISSLDGSLRDIQMIVEHSSSQTNQRHIDCNNESHLKGAVLI